MSKHCRLLNGIAFIVLTAFFMVMPMKALCADEQLPDDENVSSEKEDPYKEIALFMRVLQLLRENYVDEDKIEYKRLIHGALKGMLHELDPYSVYEEPKQYKNTVEQTHGQFGGIGIVVTVKNNSLVIIAPKEGGPGFKAGLKADDVIIKVDGQSTRNLSIHKCVSMLKGKVGTDVVLTIYRKSDGETKDITVTRGVIRLPSVKGTKIIEDGVGYIRITQFALPTHLKLDLALEDLKKQNIKALIIDLRGNPGGLLHSAIQVCSRFLEEDKLIVSTEGRKKKAKEIYKSVDCDKYLELPLVILVDRNSASASEIVAGCLQDHKRAVIVGENTFGKGSVQSVIPLKDNGAVRFTTAKYFTPSRKIIHDVGIKPDIPVELSGKFRRTLIRQIASYPGILKPDVPGAVKDYQLQRALEILKGICLFSEARKNDD